MERKRKLAQVLVKYSTALKAGEKVMIEATDVPDEFLNILIDEILASGAYPFVFRYTQKVQKQLLLATNEEYANLKKKYMMPIMEDMDAYIAIRANVNSFELSDVPTPTIRINTKFYQEPIVRQRVNHTKWVILNYPTPAFAQQAGLSTQQFEDYYFDVCTFDYAKMQNAMEALKNLMERTDRVHIVGNGTDLHFSIKGIPAVPCAGKFNIPDGEVFTAPVRESMNGHISYTIPTLYDGKRFDNVRLEVQNGKIIKATSSNTAAQNFILDTDEGARYFGEFAFGVNPYVKIPMLDILFDEKMAGSFHLTPGACYEDAYNGNHSAVHWDLVCCQTKEYGGGEIYFDDVLIRKDGVFVLPELRALNFENETVK